MAGTGAHSTGYHKLTKPAGRGLRTPSAHSSDAEPADRTFNGSPKPREKPKKRLFDSCLEETQNEFEEAKGREKLSAKRVRRQGGEREPLKATLGQARHDMQAMGTLPKGIRAVAWAGSGRKSVEMLLSHAPRWWSESS